MTKRAAIQTGEVRRAMSLGTNDPRERRSAQMGQESDQRVSEPLFIDGAGSLGIRPAERVAFTPFQPSASLPPAFPDPGVSPPTVEELAVSVNELSAYLQDLNVPALAEAMAKVLASLRRAGLME